MSDTTTIMLDGVPIEVVKTGKRRYESVDPPASKKAGDFCCEFDVDPPDPVAQKEFLESAKCPPDETPSLKELSNRFDVYVRSMYAADARIEGLAERLAEAEDKIAGLKGGMDAAVEQLEDASDALAAKIDEVEKQEAINSGLVDALKTETLRTARDVGKLRKRKKEEPLCPYHTVRRQIVWRLPR